MEKEATIKNPKITFYPQGGVYVRINKKPVVTVPKDKDVFDFIETDDSGYDFERTDTDMRNNVTEVEINFE